MDSPRSPAAPTRFHWPRKLLLLFLLILAAALGLTILFRRNTNAPLFLFNVFADAALGAIAGFGSRLVFRRRHWVLRLITAVVLCALGLLVLGQLTGGLSGVGPLRLRSVPVNWLDRFGLRVHPALPIDVGIDWWQELADVLVALSVLLLALRAWNGSSRVNRRQTAIPGAADTGSFPGHPASSPQPGRSQAPALSHVAPRSSSAAPPPAAERAGPLGLPPALAGLGFRPPDRVRRRGAPLGLPPAFGGQSPRTNNKTGRHAGTLTVKRPARSSGGSVRPRKKIRGRTIVVRSPRAAGGRVSAARHLLRRRREVRLAVYEEHRCPYCLEPVKRGDPRGTVECPICHTLHHKDCWDVTGSCQIPHLTS